MSETPNSSVPEDRSDQFSDMLDQLAEQLADVPPTPPSSRIAEDVASFLADQGEALAKQLTVARETLGLEHFSSRAIAYTREVRGKRTLWVGNPPDYAMPGMLSDEPEHLQAILERLQADSGGRASIGIWVHAALRLGGGIPCVYLRHSEGFDAFYLVKDSDWIPVPVSGSKLEHMLSAMLSMPGGGRRYWKSVYKGFIEAVLSAGPDALLELKSSLKLEREMTSGDIEAIIRNLLASKEVLTVLMEVGRSSAVAPLREAHALLISCTEVAEAATRAMREVEEKLSRSHRRELKAMSAVQDKLKSQLKIAETRIKAMELQVADLRKRAPNASEAGTRASVEKEAKELFSDYSQYFNA